jgi:prepilin signal peptidase PulO-like enzyme (type II secretory pathway)
LIAIAYEAVLAFILLVIVAFDLRWQLIPLEFTAGSAMVLAAFELALGADAYEIATGAVFIFLVLSGFVAFSRGRLMGEGDPVVGLLMGVVLGFPFSVIGLVVTFLVGGIVATALLLGGRVGRKTAVPFAPFLAAGILISVWWKEPLAILFGYAWF